MGNLLATFCWALHLLLVNMYMWLYSFVVPTGAVPSVDTSVVVDSSEVLASSAPAFASFHCSTVVYLSPTLFPSLFTPLPHFPSPPPVVFAQLAPAVTDSLMPVLVGVSPIFPCLNRLLFFLFVLLHWPLLLWYWFSLETFATVLDFSTSAELSDCIDCYSLLSI